MEQGKIPYEEELDRMQKESSPELAQFMSDRRLLMGQNAGAIDSIQPAAEIIESIVRQAEQQLDRLAKLRRAKL